MSHRKATQRPAEAAASVRGARAGEPSDHPPQADPATPPPADPAAAIAARMTPRDLAAAKETAAKGGHMTWDECIAMATDKGMDSPDNFCGYLKARKEGTYKGAEAAEPREAAIGMADEAEEQAELIGYKALAALVGQAQGSLDEIASLVDDLVATEVGEPATSAVDEESETTVETAKLGAVLAFCGHVSGTIYGIQDLCRRLLVTCGGDMNGGEGSMAMPMPGMLEGAKDASTAAVGYLTRLGKALDQIKLPDEHPLAANLKATRERIAAAKTALAQQPKAAEAATNPCGCGAAEGEMDMTKTERIKALLAKGNTPFTEADQSYLETLCENRLAALEAFAAPTAVVEEPAAPATLDEYLAAAPEALKPAVVEHQQIVAEKRAAAEARKAELVGTLKAAQAEFTEAELTEMPLVQLERLSRVASAAPKVDPAPVPATDFSGQGAPRAAAKTGDKDDAPPPPIDMTARILASRKSA